LKHQIVTILRFTTYPYTSTATSPCTAMTGQPSQYKFSVIVVGAGIGGCATALGLARRGHSVQVLEARSELSELGAGLQISPNGAKVLCAWGLRQRFEERACTPPWVQYRTYDTGETLGKHPRNVNDWYEDIYGAPYVFKGTIAVACSQAKLYLQALDHISTGLSKNISGGCKV
jgi:glycine/D-amino acid oxidase-like deaminating enzyme